MLQSLIKAATKCSLAASALCLSVPAFAGPGSDSGFFSDGFLDVVSCSVLQGNANGVGYQVFATLANSGSGTLRFGGSQTLRDDPTFTFETLFGFRTLAPSIERTATQTIIRGDGATLVVDTPNLRTSTGSLVAPTYVRGRLSANGLLGKTTWEMSCGVAL
jgi:hypothetical protein